ncbi:hypothetical protein NE237_022347 [Protea cynaroides]|uniref:Reticulon domain-containing protein n=1 Tax=Protea cynaroides TaxID=273540 RepID=A0A9Q0HCW3_9MAGN|nr:hypothetical protein NE237_022347 [Protea cynaroides]
MDCRGELGRALILLICGTLIYYHCAYRNSSLLSLVADVFIVLLCSLAILGMLFRQMKISVPVDPLEWQISQDTANSIIACLANTVGAAESVLRVAATGHDKRLFLKVIIILYLLSTLGRLASGATVAYAGLCLFCVFILAQSSKPVSACTVQLLGRRDSGSPPASTVLHLVDVDVDGLEVLQKLQSSPRWNMELLLLGDGSFVGTAAGVGGAGVEKALSFVNMGFEEDFCEENYAASIGAISESGWLSEEGDTNSVQEGEDMIERCPPSVVEDVVVELQNTLVGFFLVEMPLRRNPLLKYRVFVEQALCLHTSFSTMCCLMLTTRGSVSCHTGGYNPASSWRPGSVSRGRPWNGPELSDFRQNTVTLMGFQDTVMSDPELEAHSRPTRVVHRHQCVIATGVGHGAQRVAGSASPHSNDAAESNDGREGHVGQEAPPALKVGGSRGQLHEVLANMQRQLDTIQVGQ